MILSSFLAFHYQKLKPFKNIQVFNAKSFVVFTIDLNSRIFYYRNSQQLLLLLIFHVSL